METFVQIAGLAVAISALILLLKPQKPEIALLIAAAAGVLFLLAVLPLMSGVMHTIANITQRAGVQENYTSIMLKAVGVAYITSLGAELCRDAGQGAIAAKVELAGKIVIAALALPVIDALFSLMAGII